MRQIATLHEIGRKSGTNLVAELLQEFLNTEAEQLACIETALDAGDAAALSRHAHTLKSSTANLGAETLSGIYRRMEALGRESRVEEARALLTELKHEQALVFAHAREILEEAA